MEKSINENFILEVPVVYCFFNRFECTKQSFDRIKKSKPQKLYLISDGARTHVKNESEKVRVIRDYVLNNIDWECEVYTNFADSNMGCGRRMSSGITWVFEHEEEAIIIEDDCLVDISFFRFCQELLNRYRDNEKIKIISGYRSLEGQNTKESYLFSGFTEIWGWATWKRVWDKYDYDIPQWKNQKFTKYMSRLMNVTAQSKYKYYFDCVFEHKLDTWDYQLQYQIFRDEGLTVLPKASMVRNVGFGVDATHTTEEPQGIDVNTIQEMKFPLTHPIKIERDVEYDEKLVSTQWKQDPSFVLKTAIKRTIKRIIK